MDFLQAFIGDLSQVEILFSFYVIDKTTDWENLLKFGVRLNFALGCVKSKQYSCFVGGYL